MRVRCALHEQRHSLQVRFADQNSGRSCCLRPPPRDLTEFTKADYRLANQASAPIRLHPFVRQPSPRPGRFLWCLSLSFPALSSCALHTAHPTLREGAPQRVLPVLCMRACGKKASSTMAMTRLSKTICARRRGGANACKRWRHMRRAHADRCCPQRRRRSGQCGACTHALPGRKRWGVQQQ